VAIHRLAARSAVLSPRLCARLWPADRSANAYALLDAAADPAWVDRLRPLGQAMARSLLPGGPQAPAAAVGPWLVALPAGHPFTQALVHDPAPADALLLLSSGLPLPPLWRHLRALGRVRGPGGEPLLFRYHDPRVLRAFLATADPGQLAEFFGPLDGVFAPAEGVAAFDGWDFAQCRLHRHVFETAPA